MADVLLNSDLTNFGTWLHDEGHRLYRYWVKKNIFTPYEHDKKFMDESIYEDDVAQHGYMAEAIELPDGDVLIGFLLSSIDDDKYVEYHKLSEIKLAYCESDKEREEIYNEDC